MAHGSGDGAGGAGNGAGGAASRMALAGVGAHSYSPGNATSGSDEAEKFHRQKQ